MRQSKFHRDIPNDMKIMKENKMSLHLTRNSTTAWFKEQDRKNNKKGKGSG